jgi:hypothetical protein
MRCVRACKRAVASTFAAVAERLDGVHLTGDHAGA